MATASSSGNVITKKQTEIMRKKADSEAKGSQDK